MTPRQKLKALYDEYRKFYDVTHAQAIRLMRADLRGLSHLVDNPWKGDSCQTTS